MTSIEIILRLPLFGVTQSGPEYVKGYVDATLAPIHVAIDAGQLDVGAMFAAGWELEIPEVVPEAVAPMHIGVTGYTV